MMNISSGRKRASEHVSRDDTQPTHGEEEATDIKLALLASLSTCNDTEILLDALLACDGSVERASRFLTGADRVLSPTKSLNYSTIGYQGSLTAFFSEGGRSPKKRQLTKKGQTLHLYAPEDVAAHTPCTIIHNFLPKHQADALLYELLEEAPTFGRESFKIFDRTVSSPHTSCFYVNDWEEVARQKTDYIYNGSKMKDVRATPPEMRRVSDTVRKSVNDEIAKRILTYPDQKKLKHQSPKEWTPNTAFVNVYDGGQEHVGYHTDQMTYLGPRATIGSISLGVAREFRVRKIVPRNTSFDPNDDAAKKANDERADTEGQIAIHLPHNSLLVMHAEMQEEWKHSIAPAQAIDPHPIAKNKRINITYRHYRDSFHPNLTPRCKCDVPTILRCVQRQSETRGKYIWQCHVGQRPDTDQSTLSEKGCNFFQWAIFDDNGEPPWAT